MLRKHLTLLLGFTSVTLIQGAATINNKDCPYDPIPIRIPLDIWKKALHPTPVLKSAATIVVPIHVAGDEDYDEDELEETEVINNETVEDEASTDIVTNVVAEATSVPTPASVPSSNATIQQDVLDENELPTTAQPEVTGQVIRYPCSCIEGQCGCCTGTFLQNMNMKACGNVSFVPEDFVFDVRLSVNNKTMIRRRVSASDPPPICFNPRRAPFVRVCAEISNIRIRNNNAYACMDINADIGGFDVYSTSFRCFGLGLSGVQTGLKPKPVSNGPKPVNIFGTRDEDQDDSGGGGGGGGILDGLGSGIFGGGNEGSDSDDDGPFDAFGDAFDDIGDFLDA